ncbi:MAG TPA: glycine cleavage system protein GcvH [Smithellaceae bacterium]|jgi:glycine cleavage system H protein|nr:glycine cleavage system protein GcvH [Smithellaceae bacterium]
MSKPNSSDRLYSKDHEWVQSQADGSAVVGITDYAQEMLTDIVFVELPDVGRVVAKGEAMAVVESVKSVSDVYAPLGGEIIDVNRALEDKPELINSDAFGEGWIAKIQPADPEEMAALLSAVDYDALIQQEKH